MVAKDEKQRYQNLAGKQETRETVTVAFFRLSQTCRKNKRYLNCRIFRMVTAFEEDKRDPSPILIKDIDIFHECITYRLWTAPLALSLFSLTPAGISESETAFVVFTVLVLLTLKIR